MRPRVWSRQRPYPARVWVVPLIIAAALVAWSIGWFESRQSPLFGRAQAVDGDTLRIGEQRIRLVGLDAPELGQTCVDGAGGEWPCGLNAKAFLAELLRSGGATCARSGRDGYGRTLATCTIEDADVGAQLVAAGWAMSDFGYPNEERAARAGGLGIWSGSLISPADWRRAHGSAGPAVLEWIRSWFQ